MVVTIKVSEKVKERLERIAEKMGGVSINTVVEMLLDYYETGNIKDKPVKSKLDVELVSKYETQCSKCGAKIKVGDRFRYIRIEYEDGSKDVIRLCVDCMLEGYLLKRYYMKKRELEVVIRELRKEANELIDKINELQKQADMLKIKAEIATMIKDVRELLRNVAGGDLKTTLYQVLERLDDINNKLDKLEPIPLKPSTKPQARPQAREPQKP
jgi:antitoxin component of RelBE/YafQ-DinJ toxin-antitoxin module